MWYTWVHFGSDPAPAKGPHATVKAAREALERFRQRYGEHAGTYEDAGSVRLYAYETREEARRASISDEGHLCDWRRLS